jgi:DNA-binding NarL/FixJ family response regulator
METKLKLIIADDHFFFREGLKSVLTLIDNLEVIAEAEDGEELVKACIDLQPDIVFSDLMMPVMDGIEATKIILDILPDTIIYALTMAEDLNKIEAMMKAGANGYLTKDAKLPEIMKAIKAARTKKQYYSETATIRLGEWVAAAEEKNRSRYNFSERELAIIKLICAEKTSQEIAEELHMSKKTVDLYRTNIMSKMSVSKLSGVIMYALKNKIISLE